MPIPLELEESIPEQGRSDHDRSHDARLAAERSREAISEERGDEPT
jgi:hypothetical protein